MLGSEFMANLDRKIVILRDLQLREAIRKMICKKPKEDKKK